jgi:predicted phage terminase large subunit-like protein
MAVNPTVSKADIENMLDKVPPAKKAALQKELALRVLSRRSLLQYTKRFHPSYDAGWVHEDICRRLEQFSKDVAEKKSPRLMLLVPPRHGKSELASIRFPAWHLGHHPEHEIINCGYNTDLPMKFSRKVREQLRDKAYEAMFPDAKLDAESQSVEAWNTTMGGGFTAAGVGGGITGKGAHVLTIDDPIKNMEEADSANIRDALWDWYWSTAYTRLAPGGGVLVIQTWWNDDDLAGRLQKQMLDMPNADQFVIIKYPALAEADEYLTPAGEIYRSVPDQAVLNPPPEGSRLLRTMGEALHPSRYPTPMMENYKANMHPRIWSALYQQNPVPDEGMYFKTDWFRMEPTAPMIRKRHLFQAWDFAISEKQQNDYTVGVTILQDENNFIHVLDLVRFKGDTFVIIEEILNMYTKWALYDDTPITLGFENGQIWLTMEPVLKLRMQERNLFPPYEVMKPLSDKLVRARALQGRMQQGRVMFLESDWFHELQREMLRFPAGSHDDMVDALAWACNLVNSKAAPRDVMMNGPVQKSWKDKIGGFGKQEASHMAA